MLSASILCLMGRILHSRLIKNLFFLLSRHIGERYKNPRFGALASKDFLCTDEIGEQAFKSRTTRHASADTGLLRVTQPMLDRAENEPEFQIFGGEDPQREHQLSPDVTNSLPSATVIRRMLKRSLS
ncbi:hypothetical protein E8E15_005093 [Penicillium rubens]|jgi:hypothetical protein|uniref:uncharacterized protein n=1 Tax=Penicillium rubens TaxID=1108849 RepID=UPI001D426EAF|nr:uncharacterized protein N7525_004570 [Penicillium rubens]KAF3029237.1 hypothetical protein E8E15_005093 [Penicillium rubens]KAJ5839382.1 hypothetical protein N7525_004570 [Penicillium rubens]